MILITNLPKTYHLLKTARQNTAPVRFLSCVGEVAKDDNGEISFETVSRSRGTSVATGFLPEMNPHGTVFRL